ncbi:uncharacterized protein LOC121999368 [Zingiber officinale]|uniref:Avr9/Cf-9 rapidly elicited protein n=1 Tax=Zingiber officinale TaxID=94328 RepID=A0A8J5FRM4_ZINOF|nr:uncharacterized protein LOC121999368 [Zingiber officinale]KAG6492564.1 hypothetical protein ZIOFF_047527 [Zingiber officinale]
MESTRVGKRLWHIVRAVFYMIRQGLSKDKLMMDLHLLRKRGKLIGKALGNLMTFHHHHHGRHHHHRHHGNSLHNSVSFYSSKEAAFNCNTCLAYPSYDHNSHRHNCDYEAMAFTEALEMLNSEEDYVESSDMASSLSPAPSLWSFEKSPVAVRQLRVTDSPFPLKEEEEATDSHIDEEAEQFIKRFYEQLRLQQRITPMTPEYKHCRKEALVVGRA